MDSEKSSATTGTPTTTGRGPLIPLFQPDSHHHDRGVAGAATTRIGDHSSNNTNADTNVDAPTPNYPTLRSIGA